MSPSLSTILREYFVNQASRPDLAVTLTMKQQDGSTKLDEIHASNNLRHFLNRFNRKAFGNAFTRFQRKTLVIPMLEQSYSGRWHYHLVMENPYDSIGSGLTRT